MEYSNLIFLPICIVIVGALLRIWVLRVHHRQLFKLAAMPCPHCANVYGAETAAAARKLQLSDIQNSRERFPFHSISSNTGGKCAVQSVAGKQSISIKLCNWRCQTNCYKVENKI